MQIKKTISGVLIGILLLVVLSVATCLVFLKEIYPYDYLVLKLSRYSYTGGVEFFTHDYYHGCVQRARLVGLGLFLILILCVILIKHIFQCGRIIWLNKYTYFNELWRCFTFEKSHWERMAFWLILASGIIIRIIYVRQDVHADEARTFTAYAYRPFFIILSDWTAPNNQIFHTLLVRGCYLLLGKSLFVLRMPSFVFGILFLPIVNLWAKKLFNSSTGLLVMGFCAGGYGIVSFSVMGRGYTILFCCTYMLFLIVDAILQYPRNYLCWLMAVLFSVVGMFTIPTMLFSVLGVALWILIFSLRKDVSRNRHYLRLGILIYLVVTGILVGLAYTPAFIATDWQLINDDTTLTARRSFANILLTVPEWFNRLDTLAFAPYPIWVSRSVMILGMVGCIISKQKKNSHHVMIGVVVGVAIIFPLFVQRVIPYARLYIVYIPAVVGLFLYGIVLLCQQYCGGIIKRVQMWSIIAVLFPFLSGFLLVNKYGHSCLPIGDQVRDMKNVSEYLTDNAANGDIIVATCPVPGPLIYYLDKNNKKLRVYDLFQYVPILNKGTNSVWILASKEYGQSLNSIFNKIDHDGIPQYQTEKICGSVSIGKTFYGDVIRVVDTGW